MFCLYKYATHRNVHSFPTRRSSDLEVNYTIEEYKQAVKDYKTTNSKNKKREIEEIIDTVKNNFKSTLDNKIKDRISKRSEEHTSELQSRENLVCRLLLEKKNT